MPDVVFAEVWGLGKVEGGANHLIIRSDTGRLGLLLAGVGFGLVWYGMVVLSAFVCIA